MDQFNGAAALTRRRGILGAVVFCFSLLSLPAQSQDHATFENWNVNCSVDRMTDKRVCKIEARFGDHKTLGEISSKDFGETFMVASSPIPLFFQLRVDKNLAYPAMKCPLACLLEGQDASRLARELTQASVLLVHLTTVSSAVEVAVPVASYPRALAYARQWTSRAAIAPPNVQSPPERSGPYYVVPAPQQKSPIDLRHM